MAWGKKNGNGGSSHDGIENILGPTLVVHGDLKAEHGFRIDGTIEGSVESAGAIIVGEKGVVRGEVRGNDVVIVGRVEGNVTATGHLDIAATGKVVGDIAAKSFRIETGGVFRGTSLMGPEASDSSVAVDAAVSA